MISLNFKSGQNANNSNRHLFFIAVLSWLSMIVFDFFLHAGLLARLYLKPSPFLLPPVQAFRLIPLGYMSFLLMAFLLTWMMNKLEIVGKRRGLVFGLKFGGMVWGSFVLGLLSISTADVALLLGWLFGQALELGVAGAVVGGGLSGERLKRVFVAVLTFSLISVIITVLYQNLVLT
jgi:hypothetical protein